MGHVSPVSASLPQPGGAPSSSPSTTGDVLPAPGAAAAAQWCCLLTGHLPDSGGLLLRASRFRQRQALPRVSSDLETGRVPAVTDSVLSRFSFSPKIILLTPFYLSLLK